MIDPGKTRRTPVGARLQRYVASGVAVVVSLVSLGVALSANRTQERLLAASVWPALEYGTGNRSDDGADEITLVLGNNGVGPARLRGVRVLYKGKFAGDSIKLLQLCCELGDSPVNTVTSGTRGRVLKAGDEITFMMLPFDNNSDELWKRFNRERFGVAVRACYCSVLDDCWIFDSTRIDPEPVQSCPSLSIEEEWQG
jgi:hypothetical protein